MVSVKQKMVALAIMRARTLTAAEAADDVRDVASRLALGAGIETEDARSLSIIADMLADGNVLAARDYADTLDTGCREQIPMAVWVHMGGELIHA